MDYEKKYFDALDLMKSLYPTLEGGMKEEAERVFPELKDAKKDAKIIRAIARVLDENYMDAAVIEGVEIAEIKTWLDEQDKQLDPDDVIAWLRSFGCDVEHLVSTFKKHFEL